MKIVSPKSTNVMLSMKRLFVLIDHVQSLFDKMDVMSNYHICSVASFYTDTHSLLKDRYLESIFFPLDVIISQMFRQLKSKNLIYIPYSLVRCRRTGVHSSFVF